MLGYLIVNIISHDCLVPGIVPVFHPWSSQTKISPVKSFKGIIVCHSLRLSPCCQRTWECCSLSILSLLKYSFVIIYAVSAVINITALLTRCTGRSVKDWDWKLRMVLSVVNQSCLIMCCWAALKCPLRHRYTLSCFKKKKEYKTRCRPNICSCCDLITYAELLKSQHQLRFFSWVVTKCWMLKMLSKCTGCMFVTAYVVHLSFPSGDEAWHITATDALFPVNSGSSSVVITSE